MKTNLNDRIRNLDFEILYVTFPSVSCESDRKRILFLLITVYFPFKEVYLGIISIKVISQNKYACVMLLFQDFQWDLLGKPLSPNDKLSVEVKDYEKVMTRK